MKILFCLFGLLLVGCQQSNPPLTASKPSVHPSLRPLPEDAAALAKLLGYHQAVAYEFRGTWIECWLQCEADGKVVASTPKIVLSPQSFASKLNVNASDGEKVVGWISVGGYERIELNLTVSAKIARNSNTTIYPTGWPINKFSQVLEVPSLIEDADGNKSIADRSAGVGGLDSNWTSPPPLPDRLDEPIIVKSYQWTNKYTGGREQQMKVTLFCSRSSGT